MIEWLSNIIGPFTLCCCLLLAMRSLVVNKLGPSVSYISWLLIPASLIVPVIELPNWFALVNDGQSMQRYLTFSTDQNIGSWLAPILQYAWAVGTFSLIGYWLVRHFLLIKVQRNWQTVEKSKLNELQNSDLQVRKSDQVFSPMLVGVFKPKLVIPSEFDELFSKEQQALILEHELCHYRRGDLVWNAFALMVLAIMWFHPLAWLAFSRFRRDQELSCDQVVLARKHTTSRINYGKALLVAAETAPPLGFAQLSFKEYGDKHVMFERINLIKNKPTGSKLITTALLAGAVTLMSAISYAGNTDDGAKHKTTAIVPVTRIEPIYPEKAVTDSLEGSVVLKFDIKPSGDVTNVTVVNATPKKVFDKSAKIALRQWKYNASSAGSKNNLVQLDFLLSPESKGKFKQVEQIAVVNH
ncbi:TonB family protein [Thalassotalea sp. M1531]|uniref:Protein TonB n=1 Tax=Thalassotalea algicola TaxID=2716224 RepID=A0A7Y0Q8B7_9GAMM|nr:M56 family metallopeptidase [Thalassotalea algicola]NMP31970.1 TonB family protein [Thalassotalea algicola]